MAAYEVEVIFQVEAADDEAAWNQVYGAVDLAGFERYMRGYSGFAMLEGAAQLADR